MVNIIQITDMHLFAQRDELIKDVNSWDGFQLVLDRLHRLHPKPDFIILTGDLVHDEKLESYEQLRSALQSWEGKYRLLPGNHDNPHALRLVFPELFENPSILNFQTRQFGWLLLGLDTYVPLCEHGELSVQQLDWLEQSLERHCKLPTLIFMHHHPVPIDHPYMDSIALKNPAPFANLVNRYEQIKGIFCGHVHQESFQLLGSIPCFATPSTCFQIIPHSDPMIIAKGPPAFREILLRQAEFDSFVQWVKSI